MPIRVEPVYHELSHHSILVPCAQRKVLTQGCGTKAQLVARLIKHDAQPVVYDAWSLKDREMAAASRAVRVSEPTKAALVAALEAADRDSRFRFLDLPPELRKRIYHLTAAPDTTKALNHPVVPAICRASKLLRSESLPVFFGMNIFLLGIRGSKYERVPQNRIKVLRKAKMKRETARWLQQIVGENVGLLRRLLVGLTPFKQAYRLSLTSVELGTAGTCESDYYAQGLWDRQYDGTMWKVWGKEGIVPSGLGNLLHGIAEEGSGMTKEALSGIVRYLTDAF